MSAYCFLNPQAWFQTCELWPYVEHLRQAIEGMAMKDVAVHFSCSLVSR